MLPPSSQSETQGEARPSAAQNPRQSPLHPEERRGHRDIRSALLITAKNWGQPSVHRQEGRQTNLDLPITPGTRLSNRQGRNLPRSQERGPISGNLHRAEEARRQGPRTACYTRPAHEGLEQARAASAAGGGVGTTQGQSELSGDLKPVGILTEGTVTHV